MNDGTSFGKWIAHRGKLLDLTQRERASRTPLPTDQSALPLSTPSQWRLATSAAAVYLADRAGWIWSDPDDLDLGPYTLSDLLAQHPPPS